LNSAVFTNSGDGSGSESPTEISGEPASDQSAGERPPRRWLAALLGIVCPGLGYFHMGRTPRAIVTTLLVPGLALLLTAAGVHRSRPGGILVIASFVLSLLYPVIDVLWMRRAPAPIRRSRASRIGRYSAGLVILVVWQLFAGDLWRGLAGKACVRFIRFGGKSMQPRLLDGDMLVLDGCRPTRVASGDIAMFETPTRSRGLMMKWVAASAGQSIQVTRDAVLVDNRPFITLSEPAADNQIYGPFTVPPDTVFFIGENLPASADSRHYGVIPTSSIRGRVAYIAWSPLGGIGRTFSAVTSAR
jgi:signal peptidase I